ncbi:hypothetical protein EAG_10853 [Camponotus floridanus]|uniref:Uncharacterized protein n=1 Tax=Camponotus floridanus TaxID=104421 RepID=E2A9K1_CAMFO|nr:hypothetical protein EAG_10853 [Camponotus floridanus]
MEAGAPSTIYLRRVRLAAFATRYVETNNVARSSKRPINRPPATLNAHRRVRTSARPPKTAYEYFHVPLMGSYCERRGRRARKRGFNFLDAHEQNDVPGGRLLPTLNIGDNIRSPRHKEEEVEESENVVLAPHRHLFTKELRRNFVSQDSATVSLELSAIQDRV